MDCYHIPTKPTPLLLPVECVADVVADAEIMTLESSRASWMRGHVTWRNQRIPVMSYSDLHGSTKQQGSDSDSTLVILNPVPDAVRKAYSALVFSGEVETISVDDSAEFVDLPDGVDGRYTDAAIKYNDTVFLVPRLNALAVAFSYF